MYTKHQVRRSYIAWRCCERRICNAQLCQWTVPPHQVMRRRKHSHPPNWDDYNNAIEQSRWNLQNFKTTWAPGSADNDLNSASENQPKMNETTDEITPNVPSSQKSNLST